MLFSTFSEKIFININSIVASFVNKFNFVEFPSSKNQLIIICPHAMIIIIIFAVA